MDGAQNGRANSLVVEEEAKDRAASVVMGYRRLDWTAIATGQPEAVAALVAACEADEAARRYLEEDGGALGTRLAAGLERFYRESVAPHLQRPDVVLALARHANPGGAEPSAGPPAPRTEEGLLPRERPQMTVGHTVRMNTGCGHLYVTINESDDGKPFELFNHMGKAGGCAASQNEAIGRLISYALRCGARLEPLIKQLKGISCHRPAWGEDGKISSCSDAIGKALEKYHQAHRRRQERGQGVNEAFEDWRADPRTDTSHEATNGSTEEAAPWDGRAVARLADPGDAPPRRIGELNPVQGACVDCGSQLSYEEGCVKCHSCGFTECG